MRLKIFLTVQNPVDDTFEWGNGQQLAPTLNIKLQTSN